MNSTSTANAILPGALNPAAPSFPFKGISTSSSSVGAGRGLEMSSADSSGLNDFSSSLDQESFSLLSSMLSRGGGGGGVGGGGVVGGVGIGSNVNGTGAQEGGGGGGGLGSNVGSLWLSTHNPQHSSRLNVPIAPTSNSLLPKVSTLGSEGSLNMVERGGGSGESNPTADHFLRNLLDDGNDNNMGNPAGLGESGARLGFFSTSF